MAEYNRKNMLEAIKDHAKGHIKKHTMNVEVYLKNAAGVGEHPDVMEAVEKELKIIAEYDDQLDVINKYFEHDPLKPRSDV
jgi:hypothetical protein